MYVLIMTSKTRFCAHSLSQEVLQTHRGISVFVLFSFLDFLGICAIINNITHMDWEEKNIFPHPTVEMMLVLCILAIRGCESFQEVLKCCN